MFTIDIMIDSVKLSEPSVATSESNLIKKLCSKFTRKVHMVMTSMKKQKKQRRPGIDLRFKD